MFGSDINEILCSLAFALYVFNAGEFFLEGFDSLGDGF